MLKFLGVFLCFTLSALVWAEDDVDSEKIHAYIQDGVVYADIQSFAEESYILKVIASGSPMTVFWQFEVSQSRDYWLDKQVAEVRLGRQVIPDLVTQRWLMRDLSGGVVKYTSDAHEAMRFLTSMNHVAVVDVSVLDTQKAYTLAIKVFMYEGEQEEQGWWSSLIDFGEDIGSLNLDLSEVMQHE
jgi:hypothetical protein